MFIFIGILVLAYLGFFIHLFLSKESKTSLQIAELFLVYQLVFSVGLSSFLAFIGLTFMTQFVADYTGWPYSPFEYQLGNVNLGYGVLGILSIWFRNHFWTATILGFSIWLLGDAVGHILDMIYNHNYMPGNIGVPLYTDIIIPVILLIALAVYHYLKNQEMRVLK